MLDPDSTMARPLSFASLAVPQPTIGAARKIAISRTRFT